MKYLAALVVLGIVSVVPGLGQASQTDSQTLQAILVEIRGLHNDARLTQTSQILLAEMLMQQTAVNRALEKRDSLKSSVEQVQNQQKMAVQQVAQWEERANTAIDAAQKKQFTQMQDQMKSQIPFMKIQEQERSSDLADAESRLSREQDALASIKDQLDTLVKKLQPAAER
jgi:hypothetical protein